MTRKSPKTKPPPPDEDFKARSILDENRRRAERRSASPELVNPNTLIPGGSPAFSERRSVHWEGFRIVEDIEDKDPDASDLKDSSN